MLNLKEISRYSLMNALSSRVFDEVEAEQIIMQNLVLYQVEAQVMSFTKALDFVQQISIQAIGCELFSECLGV